MAIDQVERAARAWPVLTERAAQRATITYAQLGQAVGVHHRAIRFILGVVQDYCLEAKLPPLTILIVNASGRPGEGFIAYDLDHFEEGLEQVYSYDWEALGNPFEIEGQDSSYESIVSLLATEPSSAEDAYARVKTRGMRQMIFRDALLLAYSKKCAFTQIGAIEALEASHIIPWSRASTSERLDVRNGILLNRFHHRLVDAGRMTITKEYRIVYDDPHERKRAYSDLDRQMTSGLHGQKMSLPKSEQLWPSVEYIEKHHEIGGWDARRLET